MNSLQLVSKIKSKSDDLTRNISDLLNPSLPFNSIEKELLKKQCLDLFELLLKLKTDAEILEEKNYVKPFIQQVNTVVEHVLTPKIEHPIVEEIQLPRVEKMEEPLIQTGNFQEVISRAEQSMETLDELENKVEIQEENQANEPEIELAAIQEITETQITMPAESLSFGEINIGKITENKRIQYTVMPAVEEPKTQPLNAIFKEKDLTYNEKIAQVHPPVMVPMAEKTIEAPIDNIKSAINLNKKISLVNELFKENVVEYAKAIDRLNNATDRNDAFRIHNELKQQYQWDNHNELVMELERLIKRRFA